MIAIFCDIITIIVFTTAVVISFNVFCSYSYLPVSITATLNITRYYCYHYGYNGNYKHLSAIAFMVTITVILPTSSSGLLILPKPDTTNRAKRGTLPNWSSSVLQSV